MSTFPELIVNPLFFGFLFTGLVFIISGWYLKKNPPADINSLYGYRTNSSMKSQERWDFAQIYGAKQLVNTGIILCLMSLASLLFLLFFQLSMPVSLIAFVAILLLCSIVMIVKVENAIKKKFDA